MERRRIAYKYSEMDGINAYITFITDKSNGVPSKPSIMDWKPPLSDESNETEIDWFAEEKDPFDFAEGVTTVKERFRLLVQRGKQHVPGGFDDAGCEVSSPQAGQRTADSSQYAGITITITAAD